MQADRAAGNMVQNPARGAYLAEMQALCRDYGLDYCIAFDGGRCLGSRGTLCRVRCTPELFSPHASCCGAVGCVVDGVCMRRFHHLFAASDGICGQAGCSFRALCVACCCVHTSHAGGSATMVYRAVVQGTDGKQRGPVNLVTSQPEDIHASLAKDRPATAHFGFKMK